MGCGRFSLLLIFSIVCFAVVAAAFDPVDNYAINCGSEIGTTVSGLRFVADNTPHTILSAPQCVFARTTPIQVSIGSADLTRLYQTAVIFPKKAKYTFPIREKGRHWIRLYFFPVVYGSFDMSLARFSVSAEDHKLIPSFFHNNTYIFKEYSLIANRDALVITFTPWPLSFAFLNAIEVVSAPVELIGSANTTIVASTAGAFRGLSTQTLETVGRLNIGGLSVIESTDPLHRPWLAGTNFLVHAINAATDISNRAVVKYMPGGPTQNIAPPAVYGSAVELAAWMNSSNNNNSNSNLQWDIYVNPGFQYLVRFHLCALNREIKSKAIFSLYVNSWLVSQNVDLGALTNNILGAPYYIDAVTDLVWSSKLRISISPAASSFAVLNGLEVMKLNDTLGRLGKASRMDPSQTNKAAIIVGISLFVLVSVLCILAKIFSHCYKRNLKQARRGHFKKSIFTVHPGEELATSKAYCFSFAEIEEATRNFSETEVIGVGGFGRVYKGILSDGTKVAVKRSSPQSQQGLPEFRNEIELLSELRHQHLVPLIGYCNERNEMILVYEFMGNGTLTSHLYGSSCMPSLGWEQRLEICIGAARGLNYLHVGFRKPVIHRDVKSANILLDDNHVARVADFGLSRALPENNDQIKHISTAVRGTFGYLDPEYFRRRRLTAKSDVYSFGVVLLEALTARPVLNASLTGDMDDLAQWALKRMKAGQLMQVIDPRLVGKIEMHSLQKFSETAEKCLAEHGADRPSMEEVLHHLDHALQLN